MLKNQKNKPVTLMQWCRLNKYGGITEECIESAFQSDNDKIVEMPKKYKINKIVRRKDG